MDKVIIEIWEKQPIGYKVDANGLKTVRTKEYKTKLLLAYNSSLIPREGEIIYVEEENKSHAQKYIVKKVINLFHKHDYQALHLEKIKVEVVSYSTATTEHLGEREIKTIDPLITDM